MAQVGLVINLRAQSLRKNSRGPWLNVTYLDNRAVKNSCYDNEMGL